jgi:hypothetical protein
VGPRAGLDPEVRLYSTGCSVNKTAYKLHRTEIPDVAVLCCVLATLQLQCTPVCTPVSKTALSFTHRHEYSFNADAAEFLIETINNSDAATLVVINSIVDVTSEILHCT